MVLLQLLLLLFCLDTTLNSAEAWHNFDSSYTAVLFTSGFVVYCPRQDCRSLDRISTMQVVIKNDFLNIFHLISPHLSSSSCFSPSYASPLTSSLPSPSSYASIFSFPIYSCLLTICCCFLVFSSFTAFSFFPLIKLPFLFI